MSTSVIVPSSLLSPPEVSVDNNHAVGPKNPKKCPGRVGSMNYRGILRNGGYTHTKSRPVCGGFEVPEMEALTQ